MSLTLDMLDQFLPNRGFDGNLTKPKRFSILDYELGEMFDVYCVIRGKKPLACLDWSSYGRKKYQRMHATLINQILTKGQRCGLKRIHCYKRGGIYVKTIFYMDDVRSPPFRLDEVHEAMTPLDDVRSLPFRLDDVHEITIPLDDIHTNSGGSGNNSGDNTNKCMTALPGTREQHAIALTKLLWDTSNDIGWTEPSKSVALGILLGYDWENIIGFIGYNFNQQITLEYIAHVATTLRTWIPQLTSSALPSFARIQTTPIPLLT